MNWNWKEQRKQKHQFKSYYCLGCKQRKPCQLLTDWDSQWKNYCCWCYYQNQKERGEEYSSYEKIFISKQQEQKARFQQLQILKNYLGCKTCESKEIDAYTLYQENKLICQPCLVKKTGGSSSPISFLEQQKWFKKYWWIDLTKWLENFSQLPVNANCAKQWLKDKHHLNNCDCLEKESREIYLLFSNSLKRIQAKIKDCECVASKKVRVSSDYYAWCEICEETVAVASKKRIIKNRNDPRFWGLEIKEKVLCGNCLAQTQEQMPALKRAEFNRYRKLGRV